MKGLFGNLFFKRNYSANPDIIARIKEFLILDSKLDQDVQSEKKFTDTLTALGCNNCTITWGSTTNDLVIHKYESPDNICFPKELVYMTLFPAAKESENFLTDFGIYILDSDFEKDLTPFNMNTGIPEIIGCKYYNLADLKYDSKFQPTISPAVVVKFLSQSSNSAVQVKEILDYRNNGCTFKMFCRKLLADIVVTVTVSNSYSLKHLIKYEQTIADIIRNYDITDIDQIYADLISEVFNINLVPPEDSAELNFRTVKISYFKDKQADNLEDVEFSSEESPGERILTDEILAVNGCVESFFKTISEGQRIMLFKPNQDPGPGIDEDSRWDWEYSDSTTSMNYHHKDGEQSYSFTNIPDNEALQIAHHTRTFEEILEITERMKWIFEIR